MENHQIKVTRTAHYSTIGKASTEVKYLWIACHGYGQLAKNFIRKFDILEENDTFIIAPEGLSRFYWGGLSGDVVSSWMTKGDRQSEIEDYSNYISQLYNRYVHQLSPNVKIILLGFSQGSATIMRWVMRAFPRVDSMVFWAGMIPEDLDYRPHQKYFESVDLHFVYGDQDPFISSERIDFIRSLIAEQQLHVQEWTFEGKHTINREKLKELAAHLRKH
ncbi:MAG: alpha/beta hydrolase [Saprospiraceae bacterium]|nr:alpha/beta hydrolase [Saprospiraceae bacterium]